MFGKNKDENVTVVERDEEFLKKHQDLFKQMSDEFKERKFTKKEIIQFSMGLISENCTIEDYDTAEIIEDDYDMWDDLDDEIRNLKHWCIMAVGLAIFNLIYILFLS